MRNLNDVPYHPCSFHRHHIISKTECSYFRYSPLPLQLIYLDELKIIYLSVYLLKIALNICRLWNLCVQLILYNCSMIRNIRCWWTKYTQIFYVSSDLWQLLNVEVIWKTLRLPVRISAAAKLRHPLFSSAHTSAQHLHVETLRKYGGPNSVTCTR